MTEPPGFEAWFLANLKFLDALTATVCRQQGLRGDDTGEFAAWATERLVENDYALLRKWRGDSKLGTYVTSVVTNLGREYRIRHWGRWRPSAAAQRLGPAAVMLERLVYRDGMRLREAAERMRTSGATELSDRALAEVLAQFPVRARPRRADERAVPVEAVADGRTAADELADAEADSEWRVALRALDAALRRLPPLEETVVRMHFLEGYTLAAVARALGTEQRPLYRVKDAALRWLRAALADAGVQWEELRAVFGGALPPPGDADSGNADAPLVGPPVIPDTAGAAATGRTARPSPSNASDASRSSGPALPERSDT